MLANDTDIDASDILSVSKIVNAPANGTVIINADKTLTYTPTLNYSGTDQFTYEISDGNGGFSTAIVDLDIEAKADTPDLTVDILPGDTINQVKLRIRSALTDTDGSESLAYVIEGLPGGSVTVAGLTSRSGPVVDEFVTFTLPQLQDSDFDIVIKSTSTEASNGDQATASVTKSIVYDAGFNTFNSTFTALDQSMWGSGDAFIFRDSRFLGIDDSFETSFNAFFYGEYKTSIKAGLQSDLKISGGSVTATLPYNIKFDTFYNRTTDTLLISPTASLLPGGFFMTDSPGGSYNLDFIFNLNGSAKGGLDFGSELFGDGARVEFFNNPYSFNNTTSIIDFDTDNNPSISIDFPFGITGTLAFPSLDLSSSPGGSSQFTASGASNNFLTLSLDVDQALSEILSGGAGEVVNPFDLRLSGGITGASGELRLELLDLDLFAGANFLQSFALNVNALSVDLTFENNVSQVVNFGQGVLVSNASSFDLDNDGLIEFTANLTPDADFNNKTDLGFNLGYTFDLLKGGYSVNILGIESSDSFGPVLRLSETFPIAQVPILNNTFDLNFASQSLSFAA